MSKLSTLDNPLETITGITEEELVALQKLVEEVYGIL